MTTAARTVPPEAAALPACVRAHVVAGLEAVARAHDLDDGNTAIAGIFRAALPALLHQYTEAGLLADFHDLERTVTRGLPVLLSDWIGSLLDANAGGVGGRLYPSHVSAIVGRVVRSLSRQLDPSIDRMLLNGYGGPEPDDRARSYDSPPWRELQTRLLTALEIEIRTFAASVLIGGEPPTPTTQSQRAEARARRLADYIAICRLQGITADLSSVWPSPPPGARLSPPPKLTTTPDAGT